ncbi:hypothetical protein [uncultured Pseudokineococcus sp.]|uniref:hypothetical protein n=1 Tax=uncultured Pseudokineococcus sp. TaxID=1642928 RepID=UPI002611AD97|nr:hypothetical protein [uncultured Pseudokineococcus sp.]
MSILISLLGVSLGCAYTAVVHRRTTRADPRRWLLLVPVWVVYVLLLLTAVDMSDPLPRGVQAFTIATVLSTVVDLLGGLGQRRSPTPDGDRVARHD